MSPLFRTNRVRIRNTKRRFPLSILNRNYKFIVTVLIEIIDCNNVSLALIKRINSFD